MGFKNWGFSVSKISILQDATKDKPTPCNHDQSHINILVHTEDFVTYLNNYSNCKSVETLS